MKKLTALILIAACAVACAQSTVRECDVRVVPQLCNAVRGPDLAPLLPTGFKVVGVADFNNDHYPDLFLFNDTTGESYIWYLRPEHVQ